MEAAQELQVENQRQGIVDYQLTDQAITALSVKYLALIITDLEDKAQLETVHEARMDIKNRRVRVQKQEKELKKDANDWRAKVGKAAKHIYALLLPIEEHLMKEEKKVLEEEERIKAEEAEKQKVIIQSRVDELLEYGKPMPFMELAVLDDEEYDTLLFDVKEDFNAEEERKAEEEAAFQKEKVRLAKIADEQDVERKHLEAIAKEQEDKDRIVREKQRAAQDKIDADRKAIDDEKARIAQEVADKANAKAKAEQEKRDAKERERAVIAEKARQEALKPDKEKLNDWVEKLSVIQCADLSSEEAQFLKDEIYHKFDDLCDWARTEIENL